MKRYKIICSECGGENLIRDAVTRWNVHGQAWAIAGLYDEIYCDDCGRIVEADAAEIDGEDGNETV